jgi:hypothetical protein
VDAGKRVPKRADELDVVREIEVRVFAADHVDLGEAGALALLDRLADELLDRPEIGVVLLRGPRERAELALHPADVRVVQVDVLDEVDVVAAAATPPRRVGELAELEDVVRLHEGEAVLEVEPRVRLDLLPDRVERGLRRDGGHQLLRSTTA